MIIYNKMEMLQIALKAEKSKREQIHHENVIKAEEKTFYADRKLKFTPENSLALLSSASIALDLLIQSSNSSFQHRELEFALDCVRAVQKRIYEERFTDL